MLHDIETGIADGIREVDSRSTRPSTQPWPMLSHRGYTEATVAGTDHMGKRTENTQKVTTVREEGEALISSRVARAVSVVSLRVVRLLFPATISPPPIVDSTS